MNLSGINLNLLPVLNALLQERNITHAAQKLNLPQSSVSRSLQVLRESLSDTLLVKSNASNRMDLTKRAEEIAPILMQMLQETKGFFADNVKSKPGNIKYTYRLALNEMLSTCLLPAFVDVLDKNTPEINIILTTLNDFYQKKISEVNEIDLAIVATDIIPPDFESHLLTVSENVCMLAKNNKALKNQKPILEILKEFKHILTVQGKYNSALTNWHILYKRLMKHIPEIEITELPYLESAIKLMEKGNYLTIQPEIVAKKFCEIFSLEIIKFPFPMPKCKFKMIWPRHKTKDTNHKYFREEVKKAFMSFSKNESI